MHRAGGGAPPGSSSFAAESAPSSAAASVRLLLPCGRVAQLLLTTDIHVTASTPRQVSDARACCLHPQRRAVRGNHPRRRLLFPNESGDLAPSLRPLDRVPGQWRNKVRQREWRPYNYPVSPEDAWKMRVLHVCIIWHCIRRALAAVRPWPTSRTHTPPPECHLLASGTSSLGRSWATYQAMISR